MRTRVTLIISFFLALFHVNANVKLPALFTDNMMLQQQMAAPLWGWALPGENLIIMTSWDSKTYTLSANNKGQWNIKVNTPNAGGPYYITIRTTNEIKTINNILIGEVWLCSGQSNMEMPLKGFMGQPVLGGNEAILSSTNSSIRFISVPRKTVLTPQDDFKGSWQSASPQTTANFSATAWYFGSLLQKTLQVPVGMIEVSYGGSNIEAWMSAEMLKDFKGIDIPTRTEDIKESPNRKPTTIFNGMLSPTLEYGIKGAIWYQGESNIERPFAYKSLLKKMVSSWRRLWNQGEFPFYFVQIAPFDYSIYHSGLYLTKYNSAYLREAQLQASKEIPNSAMAVLMDIGEKNNIHPADKKKAGHRLAYLALAKTYGLSGFEYESPIYRGMEVKGSIVTVSFSNVPNGITTNNNEVKGFELAGEDQMFYPAKAILRSKSVLLSSPRVDRPVAIRYLFKDFATAEIFSTGGLPMSSFRTDNWYND